MYNSLYVNTIIETCLQSDILTESDFIFVFVATTKIY
jgi:hypothetical protein